MYSHLREYRRTGYRICPPGTAFCSDLNRATDGRIRDAGKGDVPTDYATRTSSGGVALGAKRRDFGQGPPRQR